MDKKEYWKPTVSIVKLQHQCQLLSGSGSTESSSSAGVQNYNWHTAVEE